ncbi:MAG: hypothetical protein ACQEVT_10200 [Pseudomonadota bacterium]|uniref:hypothetical protein n=1 Tax=Roseovarius TaxID=74030 RepID=UPI0022A8176E|nr:hypothetical protein [Roseovarius sp. EGI FJ00037]MCZ0813249.1 hypothetical protein [Roseovarius sp. EGI FJ00037]
MTGLRAYLGIALALVMVLAGQALAVARTAPDAAGQIEICTGSGPVMVMVDANGEPTGATHICPECALALFQAIISSDGPVLPRRVSWFLAQATEFEQHILTVSALAPRARAPPVAT